MKRHAMALLMFFLLGLVVVLGGEKIGSLKDINDSIARENTRLIQERDEMKSIISQLESRISVLEYTSERQLTNISELIDKGDEVAASAAIDRLRKDFPHAPELAQAEKMFAALSVRVAAEREEEERRKRLRFKAVKVQREFALPDVRLSISGVKVVKQWIFDSYDYNYHYRDSERGHRHVTARVDVTANKGVNDPYLPHFSIYRMDGDGLWYVVSATYKFVKWSDYGAYLGNYNDSKNDFMYSEKVSFTIGADVKDEFLSEPLFLVAEKKGCHERKIKQFGRPSIRYLSMSCISNVKPSISLDDILSDKYVVAHILNASKL